MDRYFAAFSGWFTPHTLLLLVLLSSVISLPFSIKPSCAAGPTRVEGVLSSVANSSKNVEASSELDHHPLHQYDHNMSLVTQNVRSSLRHKNGDPHHPRQLYTNFGCMGDPAVCLTVPGWTRETQASTCCTPGFCIDIQFDPFNCGRCGNICNFGDLCCSAVCVPVFSDPHNCGRCANSCGGLACRYGFCNY